jgi:hypothetical protein
VRRVKTAVGVAILTLCVLAGVGGRPARSHASPALLRPAAPDFLTLRPSLANAARTRVPAAAKRAASWCGTTSASDRPAAATGYAIHVVYAVPSDGSDNSAALAPTISDMIDRIDSWWQREDPSRMPRFDVYQAPCGPQLDLTVVRVPTISVGTTDGHQVFDQLWTQFQSDPGVAYTKFLVFVDDINTGNLCGVGSTSQGAALGQPSYGVASVFLQSCNGADQASTAAHELLHAVSPAGGFVGAPHTCGVDLYHVCDSSGDILYPYAESGIPLTSLQLDYGHDDYWAGNAPVNLQVQPWFRHTQDQVHLGLTFNGQGEVQSDLPGLDCTATCGSDWDRGDSVRLTATPAAGQRFIRWSGGCNGVVVECSLTLDTSKDVTAVFAPATFPLAVRVTGSGTVTSSPNGLSCRKGTCSRAFPSFTTVSLTEKPAKGWRFTGWSGACRGTRATCRAGMNAATSVRATFKKKPSR